LKRSPQTRIPLSAGDADCESEGRRSFLKKRTKKLLPIAVCGSTTLNATTEDWKFPEL
jgi:hypothetical protein